MPQAESHLIVGFVNLFFAGILAGTEFVVRYGVRAPLSSLEERPQIELRQALIYQMRVRVAAVFLLTAISALVVIVVDGAGAGLAWRGAGIAAIAAWAAATFLGTVPINSAVLAWQPGAPPEHWRTLLKRWERLDTLRTWAAAIAFASFLAAMAVA
jgi:hypothetical protein